MKTPAVLVIVVLMTAAVAQERTPPARPGAAAGRVGELRKERVAVLKEAADASLKLAQHARVELRVALDDRVELLQAELELAATEPDRAALRRQALDALTQLEEIAQARAAAGRGTQLDVLRVKAARLGVEIQAEQAKGAPAR